MVCGGFGDENVNRGVTRRVTPYIRHKGLTIVHSIHYVNIGQTRCGKGSHTSSKEARRNEELSTQTGWLNETTGWNLRSPVYNDKADVMSGSLPNNVP